MNSKSAQKELERINKLSSKEKEFIKKTFLYDYLVLIAHKGSVDHKNILDED